LLLLLDILLPEFCCQYLWQNMRRQFQGAPADGAGSCCRAAAGRALAAAAEQLTAAHQLAARATCHQLLELFVPLPRLAAVCLQRHIELLLSCCTGQRLQEDPGQQGHFLMACLAAAAVTALLFLPLLLLWLLLLLCPLAVRPLSLTSGPAAMLCMR
jgi:hypothetical protein